LKYFPSSVRRTRLLALAVWLCALGWTISALGELPSWVRKVEGGSALEAVFFRMMSLPGGSVPFRRPPHETRPALTDLIKAQSHNAELYSLRALEDEQQLDPVAAESDWKAYLDNSSDKIRAQFALADFYHRRLRPADEIKILSAIATAPPIATEKLTPALEQRSWHAFERIFTVVQRQGLPGDVSISQYRAWIARYPQERSLYARFLQFLVAQKEYSAAGQLVSDYRKQFPSDQIFPVKAKAMVEYRQGSVRQGLAVYEQSFQPLWDPELVKSYFDLLRETQSLRKFLDQARAARNANPEDMNAMARTFYYYQQQGKLDVAEQTITDFRLHKEAARSAWTSQDLSVCARLLNDVHAYPESARYYFALYSSQGMPDAQEQAIAGLTSLLLTAPETAIRFGSGELSMYRDIATMDQGPGYLNGILSLILNTTAPGSQYWEEEQRAVPYFHRSRAAELLAVLDTKFPNSPRRPELHATLLDFYANAGQSAAVIQGGREFLANFPNGPQRTPVALLMADAYARQDETASEFAIYDSVLKELAAQAQNVPLGSASEGLNSASSYLRAPGNDNESAGESEPDSAGTQASGTVSPGTNQAFQIDPAELPGGQGGARSPEYARVLERYLARLVQLRQIPQALGVLRHEIDRNPDDPGLYERLAIFLDQNRLGAEQEEVYRRALARFPDRSWYDKLARFYVRYKRDNDFEQLTQQAIKVFSGTELERYFAQVVYGSPALYLRLNQYANQRFPHNPAFVRNLLYAYERPETRDAAAWEALLRQHWFEETSLRNQFFEYLSRSGQLESELTALKQSAPDPKSWENNPAAANFLAYADLWRSHFEESAPVLKSLAAQYPAEVELGRTASSVFRSLAYFEPADTAVAAGIENNLSKANPGAADILARVGDIYADRDLFAQAAPYWERIPQVDPGQAGGYLEAATIYWDYYDFDNALRLLNHGRERLGNPNLYSYEAGAIAENQRDYPRAIEEYVKGALWAADSPAEFRLLTLARRPRFRDLVDQATTKIAPPPNPPMSAVYLRVKILEAQNRRPEMEAFLEAIANRTPSIEQAEAIETLARQKSLESVRQHALEKQAVLATDPVTRLQLRYALIRLYEGRKDFQSAGNNIEALYRENPKILGVVRSTVDFYWRTKAYPQAISVLLQAAGEAYPELGKQFTYEAARKSAESRQYQQARGLLTELLKDSPYNGEYLAAMADTYAQAGDDHGLQQFYVDHIALFRNAPLPADTRKAQIATLRRGLIPALTRMKDYAGAVDQYIELINNFPEDDALVTEAALYGLRYRRQAQLVDFYSRTVIQSPRDYRWSMVLAHVLTDLENYPAAIATYAKAIAIRPDRVDLYTARAGLEERLMRFDDAASDYQRIYQLAYKNPQWMEKVAEVRARQGKNSEVVAALKVALVDGRPENAANYFEVARRLESWGMLDQARAFAEQGTGFAGSNLLARSEYLPGAKTYVRIMTRLRRHEQAYGTMQTALADAAANLPVLKEQLARQGISGLTDEQWRKRERDLRIETARNGMAGILDEMGTAVDTYFTPEQRLAFAQFAEAKRNSMNSTDVEKFAIPLARAAHLADQEAQWRFDLMIEQPGSLENDARSQQLVELQRHRTRFAELGWQMEQFAKVVPPAQRDSALFAAADAYRSSGDPQNELRVLLTVPVVYLGDARQQRLFQLLLAREPQELVKMSGIWSDHVGEKAANYVLAHADATRSHSMVGMRGKPRPPVWTKSYNALVGLYFAEPAPDINRDFLGALGDNTIAERLAKPVDRSEQIAGHTWFYYGSRYGEYLGISKLGDRDDFLAAILEESPASSAGYLTLADYYAGAGDTKLAIADYNHALELSPNRPDVYDSLAVAYSKQGDRSAALAQWKQAFAALTTQLNSTHLPETFWSDFGRTCDQLHARHLFTDLKPDADAILRTYLRRNGNYRSNALLHPAYLAVGDPAAATAWLLDVSADAHDPTTILADLVNASWIPLLQRAPIYQRILESKQDAVARLDGLERDYAQQDVNAWQVNWIGYLVRIGQYGRAADAMNALPKETRDAQAPALVPLDLQGAAKLGTLDAKIVAYRAEPQTAPPSPLLRAAARQLADAGDKQSARKILEFVFAQDIDEHQLVAANFLGLAEIRLAAGDTPGAVDLLRRLVVVVGNPFGNLDPAAALLEKTGHNAEAIEFLDQLVKSAPWDASYGLRLAKARAGAGQDAVVAEQALTSIASGSGAAYGLRIKAALALAGRAHGELGSGELNLLAAAPPAIPAGAADTFYFYEARIKAAQSAADAQTKVRLLSHCVIDYPRRDQARVPLFEAEVRTQSYEPALGALEPMFQTEFPANRFSSPSAEQDIFSSDAEEQDTAEQAVTPAVDSARLSRAQQARVANMIGDTMIGLSRLDDAVSYFEIARRYETAGASRKDLARKLAHLKATLRIQHQNAARQPLLHEALEQDRVVGPRLMARGSPAPKPAARQAGLKP
jgi:tetratricopeptide (TPR) repeat protein